MLVFLLCSRYDIYVNMIDNKRSHKKQYIKLACMKFWLRREIVFVL